MKIQMNQNYRLIGNSLYERRGDSYLHCAVVPLTIKDLPKAIRWYEDRKKMKTYTFDLCFSIETEKDFEDLTEKELQDAIRDRLSRMVEGELLEAIRRDGDE